MSLVFKQLGDDEYIGYTLHYSGSDDFNTVAAHLKEKASAGSKFRFGIFPRAHENFIFFASRGEDDEDRGSVSSQKG